jgi:hypothetical protein
MSQEEAVTEFKEGLTQLKNRYASKALTHFSKAVELDKQNPFYISYLGVSMAAAKQQWSEAEELCYGAVRMKRHQPELSPARQAAGRGRMPARRAAPDPERSAHRQDARQVRRAPASGFSLSCPRPYPEQTARKAALQVLSIGEERGLGAKHAFSALRTGTSQRKNPGIFRPPQFRSPSHPSPARA